MERRGSNVPIKPGRIGLYRDVFVPDANALRSESQGFNTRSAPWRLPPQGSPRRHTHTVLAGACLYVWEGGTCCEPLFQSRRAVKCVHFLCGIVDGSQPFFRSVRGSFCFHADEDAKPIWRSRLQNVTLGIFSRGHRQTHVSGAGSLRFWS